MSAIWLAFVAARKLVAPINDLVEGTKAVAAGDYEKQLTLSGNDELGFLLRSFNTMTRKISRSRAIAEQSQRMEALQRNYLESVMEHITSGVLTIDETGFIISGNPAACLIFDIEDYFFSELYIADVVTRVPDDGDRFSIRGTGPSEQSMTNGTKRSLYLSRVARKFCGFAEPPCYLKAMTARNRLSWSTI